MQIRRHEVDGHMRTQRRIEAAAKVDMLDGKLYRMGMAEPVFIRIETIQPSWDQMDRNRALRSDFTHVDECFVCKRGLTETAVSSAWWCHLVGGGSEIAPVALIDDGSDLGDMGWFPLGPECSKQIPATHRTRMR